MKRIPAELSLLLSEVKVRLPALLGQNLVGIYLHGSVTQASFNPQRSDVDVIVVTRRELSERQFREVGAWLSRTADSNPWTKRMQMQILIRDEVLRMNSKACLYQFAVLKRSGSDGNPIIWIDVLKSGTVLCGVDPRSFVPAITPQILLRALKRELDYLSQEITQKSHSEWRDVPSYRAYAVLTVCRILYSFRNGTIVSKPTAAKWAIKHLSGRWHELILQALESDEGKHRRSISCASIEQFIRFAEHQIHGTGSSPDVRRRNLQRVPSRRIDRRSR